MNVALSSCLAKITLIEDRHSLEDWAATFGVSFPYLLFFAIPFFWNVQFVPLVELPSIF